MRAIKVRVEPVCCPVCGGFMVREKVTRHMRRVLKEKAGPRHGVMAWRGAFCCHRIAMVGASLDYWTAIRVAQQSIRPRRRQ